MEVLLSFSHAAGDCCANLAPAMFTGVNNNKEYHHAWPARGEQDDLALFVLPASQRRSIGKENQMDSRYKLSGMTATKMVFRIRCLE